MTETRRLKNVLIFIQTILNSCLSSEITLSKEVWKWKERHLRAIARHIYSKAALFWIWIGLVLAVVSRLFFYKSIVWRFLRNFADNLHKYKANFLWWFPTNLKVFMVCEVSYSDQFRYLIKNPQMTFRVKREVIARKRMKKEPTIYMTWHIFINIVYFLIFADKSWFKVTIYLFIFRFMCIFKSKFAANECYKTSKLTIE